MKYALPKAMAATLLLSSAASARLKGPPPPPKYPIQLDNATVDDALFAVAEAGNVNIIADATDWPETDKTVTADNEDSTIGWLLGLNNEFGLTINEIGRDHLGQMTPYPRNYVMWREPDIEPILQQAQQMHTAPDVPNDADGNPTVQPPNMTNQVYTFSLVRWQQDQVSQQVAAWLTEQGVTSDSIHEPRDFPSSQLPEPLREALRQVARVELTNAHLGMSGVRPDAIRKLDDEFWQKARLVYRRNKEENSTAFYIESEDFTGQTVQVGFLNLLKVGNRGAR